jgi:hypothetical protein
LAQAQVAYSLALLDKALAKSKEEVTAYYDRVRQETQNAAMIEIDALKAKRDATKDAAEAADLNLKIQAKSIELGTKLVGIDREQAVALKELAENQGQLRLHEQAYENNLLKIKHAGGKLSEIRNRITRYDAELKMSAAGNMLTTKLSAKSGFVRMSIFW